MNRKPHKNMQDSPSPVPFTGRKRTSDYLSLDLIPDPFLILNADGTIYEANASCAQLLGTKKEYLNKRHYRDFEPLVVLTEKMNESISNAVEDFDLLVYNNKHFEVLILPFRSKGDMPLIRIIFKDISNFVSLEKELLKRNKELIIINSLSSAFISSDNMEMVIENLLKKVLLVVDLSMGWFLLKEDQSFRLKSCKGVLPDLRKRLEDGALASLCNDVINIEEPLYIVESSEIAKLDFLRKDGVGFLAAVPLKYAGNVLGILFLASRGDKQRNFDFDFAALLSLVGNHVSLIIDKIRLFQETKRLSITDGLTGLFNTRYFYKQLDLEIARSNRYGNPFSLILFDIDNFKQLNDTYGHQTGDDVLMELAAILQASSRETDVVVRYGGEEFIIILPNTPEQDAIYLSDRIRSAVERNIFLLRQSKGLNITLSGGIASYPLNASGAKSLLNAADSALYSAKAAGKNKIVCFKGKTLE